MTIKTIQERLEEHATLAAEDAARRIIADLPPFQGNVTIDDKGLTFDADGAIGIGWSVFRNCMQRFMKEQFYEQYLDQFTQELMSKLGR